MNNREFAIQTITNRVATKRKGGYTKRSIVDFYGENVFNDRVQKERLAPDIYHALQKTVKMGQELDSKIADSIALAMKDWALEKGATHFCHWFQPLTDLTAEKHDSFFMPTATGTAVADFTGKMLIRGEPDASSFPSGGLRATFEARGYTAWDPTTPAFITGRTLVIPTVFISWSGEALDKKTPLLRSMEALNHQAMRILRLFGDQQTKRVIPTVGAEQEYFLIDKNFYNLRPDLIFCGRTLFGAKPSKGQELEDQYLGTISDRVISVMEEVEFELMRLGVPIKTRHNEVAPSQYELAITYEWANLAADHHMMIMEVLKKCASNQGMACLLHEKPFAGINGSGKHNNWSLETDEGQNLLEPGETPQENAQFLLFCAGVIRAVHKYAKLLRMSVATPGNDHRLGQHEAPPAIMSVFLGEQLHAIFQHLATGQLHNNQQLKELKLGVTMLPMISRHLSDRNRTSPFAFTGNKFEFRAVGSGENISKANTILNTIVAESLDYFANELEGKKGTFHEDLQTLLSKTAKEILPILFEGDNYSSAWVLEAEKRGLPNITNTVDAALEYTSIESLSLFTKYKVYSRRELESRQEITLSKYKKKLIIEAKTASNIVHTLIIPAVVAYIKELGEAMKYLHNSEHEVLKAIMKEFGSLKKSLRNLDEIIHKIPSNEILDTACYIRDRLLPNMQIVRSHSDRLEELVSDKLWPLPKYSEMLYIR